MNDTARTSLLGRPHPRHRKERRKAGRERREEVPLEAHAATPAPADRGDPIAIVTTQDAARLAELVPIRHGRMSATAFTFYRGGAAIMAADLAQGPSSDVTVQLCGDAHVSNFGLFNGPDRRLVFDLNDFDETHPGPFEWDVKRLAASVAVAGRNNELSDGKIERAVLASVSGYRRAVAEFSRVGPMQAHYRRVEIDEVLALVSGKRKNLEKATKKASGKNSLRALDKLTTIVDGRRVIVPDPPLITRIDDRLENELPLVVEFFDRYLTTLAPYRWRLIDRYAIVDIARKVVGVGSVGTRCLIVLLESGNGEPLFIQLKEATPSVLEAHLGASEYEPGQRVVLGQRLMQTMGDILLGWSHFRGDDLTAYFYARQLWDGKGSVAIENMGGRRLLRYAEICGAVLALAHARAGDASLITGYIGDDDTFDQAIAEFSHRYADLNEDDHRAHQSAIESGAIASERDI